VLRSKFSVSRAFLFSRRGEGVSNFSPNLVGKGERPRCGDIGRGQILGGTAVKGRIYVEESVSRGLYDAIRFSERGRKGTYDEEGEKPVFVGSVVLDHRFERPITSAKAVRR